MSGSNAVLFMELYGCRIVKLNGGTSQTPTYWSKKDRYFADHNVKCIFMDEKFRISNETCFLTLWGRVTHICVGKLIIIGSDNGLSPGRRPAIIWTSAGILLIGLLGTNFSDFFYRNSYIFVQENTFESVVCEMASVLSRLQCVKI